MSESNNVAETMRLRVILDSLIGKTVTKIIAGGSAGSIIGIYFNGQGKNVGTDRRGDWYIGIECCWRLDNATKPLTSSQDDNSDQGPMLQGLNSLVGHVVSAVVASEPAFDLAILFTEGKKLSVFCDLVRDGICWYLLNPEGEEVSVEPAGTLDFS
jgi:hypothetical protein